MVELLLEAFVKKRVCIRKVLTGVLSPQRIRRLPVWLQLLAQQWPAQALVIHA